MIALGIVLGLSAATGHAVAFLFSRRFLVGGNRSPMQLIVIAHVMMGAAAVVVLVPWTWLWWNRLPPVGHYIWPLLGAAAFYLIGQVGFQAALGRTDASRVAPLLGLKIVFVALVAMLLLGKQMGALQWTAVGLAVSAAFVLNRSGGWVGWGPVLGAVFACACYALSDIQIVQLIEALSRGPGEDVGVGVVWAGVLAALMSYVICGVVTVGMLPWFGSRQWDEWKALMPYASMWLSGIVLMFTCIGVAGVVLANILLACRGLISVALGPVVAWFGMEHLEQRVSQGVFWRRAAGAALMILAVGLFVVRHDEQRGAFETRRLRQRPQSLKSNFEREL